MSTSSSRSPRPRTVSSTPRGKSTQAASSSTANRGLTPPTLKTKTSTSRLSPRPKVSSLPPEPEPPSPSKALTLKEQIALRRAEQLKKGSTSKGADPREDIVILGGDAASPTADDDFLGRWSIRESVDRAKSSGSLNLASRELTRIPTYLFESHLTQTPAELKDAPPEVVEPEVPSKIKKSTNTTWYEQTDLSILKIGDNQIVELQSELSLFGSLKIVDLHRNKLKRLPNSFADLVSLINLDLSENELEELPENISSLPALTTLNVSKNQLSTIPFKVLQGSSSKGFSSFFAPVVERAKVPMPALKVLLASNNKLRAEKFQAKDLPENLTEVDLSQNDLGPSTLLLQSLARLSGLKSLRLLSCNLTDDSFLASSLRFPSLNTLNLQENDHLTENAVRSAVFGRVVELHAVDQKVAEALNIVMGKEGPVKEAWEIEAENRGKSRGQSHKETHTHTDIFAIGEPSSQSNRRVSSPISPKPTQEHIKESWELDAEQGLLTEGGRRRARAAAAAAALSSTSLKAPEAEMSSLSLSGSTTPTLVHFYDGPHYTLTLPRSQTRTHARSFSLVPRASSGNAAELVVPAPTLPLPIILSQAFANSIRVLILSYRKMDNSIILPSSRLDAPVLPHLEELVMDNCNLSSLVQVAEDGGSPSPVKESLIEIISALFPSLGTLDLSYNQLTTLNGVGVLFTPDPSKKRKGLRSLQVRGNKISSVESLEDLASTWNRGSGVDGWRGEEIDIRENEISRLPPILGLLPLDVFLVENNTFRVPARRVWEKDGSKGLLKWLAERIQ